MVLGHLRILLKYIIVFCMYQIWIESLIMHLLKSLSHIKITGLYLVFHKFGLVLVDWFGGRDLPALLET